MLAVAVSLSACVAASPDPRVQAAEAFRSTVFDLIGKDEAQTKRLNSLRLGMTDQEVLAAAGVPSRRDSRTSARGRTYESWVYNGELSLIGTLFFEDGKLAQIATSTDPPAPIPAD